MKTTNALISSCIIFIGAAFCSAQTNMFSTSSNAETSNTRGMWNPPEPNIPLEATNWGESISGVRLTIMCTNSTVATGSSVSIVAIINNLSTNAISVDYTDRPSDYDILLSNSRGRVVHLTPPPALTQLNYRQTILPGEHQIRRLEVAFPQDVEPGDYTLKAMRLCNSSQGNFLLESNPVKIQVK